MNHDPLCPTPECDYGKPEGSCMGYADCLHHCQCRLIATTRADEREKARHDFQTACIDIELLIQTLIGVNERLGGSGGISDIL